jgi:hypothetical protein
VLEAKRRLDEIYADIYSRKEDGIRRSQLLEMMVRLALKCFPEDSFLNAVTLFLSQMLP